MKLLLLVAVPPGVVTLIGPLPAPAGTVALICDAETTVKTDAVPVNATPVAPLKFVPLTVTDAPTAPLAGLNPDTVGTGGAEVTRPSPKCVLVALGAPLAQSISISCRVFCSAGSVA